MKLIKTGPKRSMFDLLHATRSLQAVMMTLRPGAASDDEPSNEHPHCEQWVYVISGNGKAVVGKRRTSLRGIRLAKHALLLIEKGELHQIVNTGKRPLRTINFYAPPAYLPGGEPKA